MDTAAPPLEIVVGEADLARKPKDGRETVKQLIAEFTPSEAATE